MRKMPNMSSECHVKIILSLRKVKLWSTSSYLCLSTLKQTAPITTLGLSHLLLTSCSIDGAVFFWSLDSLQTVMKMHTNNGAYLRQLAQYRNKYFGAGRLVSSYLVCPNASILKNQATSLLFLGPKSVRIWGSTRLCSLCDLSPTH